MATEQSEFGLPTPDDDSRKSARFLPRFFRSEANLKFLQATIDQLIQPGVAEKLSGYYGRKTAKGFKATDTYIPEYSANRQNYQLEPTVLIKDSMSNTTFYKDYNDYINQLNFFNVNTSNHSDINSQRSYSWNPNIDWDKFVNFREYYWLPDGPTSVFVQGQDEVVQSTYTITTEDQGDNVAYVFNNKFERNPNLRLFRGQRYRFEINTPGFPLAIAITKSYTPGNSVIIATSEGLRSDGQFDAEVFGEVYDAGDYIILPEEGGVTIDDPHNSSTLYPDGIKKIGKAGDEVANAYIEKGVIEFTIPYNAPDRLFYVSQNNIDTSGEFRIYDIEENTFLDVEQDIIGAKYYKSANGVEFTNGLKVSFRGNTSPKKYADSSYYVEGVGTAIELIPIDDLLLPLSYSNNEVVEFDTEQFDKKPFATSTGFPQNSDYITINRSSNDRNSWTRSNRWFHKSVLEATNTYNSVQDSIDETQKASRPIIEFESNLKLHNYGTEFKQNVDLIDTFTTDIFSVIEGSLGYNVDGVELVQGMRVLFTADTDIRVKGKIYEVNFVRIVNDNIISLIETSDTLPLENENVLVKDGTKNKGRFYYFTGAEWKQSQEKTKINQPPLFDICGNDGLQYSDLTVYDSTTFKGTKLFSYKQGSGVSDTVLGFPLSYRNINNSGDIVFDFNLENDTFTYEDGDVVKTKSINTGFLKKYTTRTDYRYVNGWSSIPTITKQKVIREYTSNISQQNDFQIDVYNNASSLNDVEVSVFVNTNLRTDYQLNRINSKLIVRFDNDLAIDDFLVIKTHSQSSKNNNGYYEFPINLERNPSNLDISSFTLGEVSDHLNSMIEDIPNYAGEFPGNSNLRDLGDIDQFGKRFIKHTGPLNLPIYSITNKDYNIVRAIEHANAEYNKFKRNFFNISSTLGFDGEIKPHVDAVLDNLNKDKLNTQSFYFSDMLGYKGSKKIDYTVFDTSNPYYSLTEVFSMDTLSSKAVNVYHNGRQLIHNKDYIFVEENFVKIELKLDVDDKLEIYEYNQTDGSFIPPTPSKLGLYPAYHPELVIDEEWLSSQGTAPKTFSAYKVYGESEDSLHRGWFAPLYVDRGYAKAADPDGAVKTVKIKGSSTIFYAPASLLQSGVMVDIEIDEYPLGKAMIVGHDGSRIQAFKDYRDSLFLDLEARIFNNIKIDYNTTLINIDEYLSGKFRTSGIDSETINRVLLKDFIVWNKVNGIDYSANPFYNENNQFTFNYSQSTSRVDGRLLPGFWRGAYIEVFDTDRPHTHPWEMIGFTVKPKWWDEQYGASPYTSNNSILWTDIEQGIVREPGKQIKILDRYARPGLKDFLPVDSQGKLKSPVDANYAKNIQLSTTSEEFKFGDHAPVENAWRKSSEYPFSIIKAVLLNRPAEFIGNGYDTSRIKKNLANQYVYDATDKPITLPDLQFPSTQNDTTTILTSGLVNFIHNLIGSNVLKVYTDYKYNVVNLQNKLGFKLAGYTDKSKIKIILDSKSPSQKENSNIFVPEENVEVLLNTSSPVDSVVYTGLIIEKVKNGFTIKGYDDETTYFSVYNPVSTNSDVVISEAGVSGSLKKQFSQQVSEIPYGTLFKNVQGVLDHIIGYGKYLETKGFTFDYFDTDTNEVINWTNSAKQFLYWVAQGWSDGTTLRLSPAAYELNFKQDYAIVDDIYDNFYKYSLQNENAQPLQRNFSSILRDKNSFSLKIKNSTNGIYNLKLPLVQKEHVILIDNETIFNDIIYQPSTGYRQERLKVIGYRSDNWDGSLNIPGFIYDDAKVTEWEPWQDYEIGNLVKHKEFYYVALYQVSGAVDFNYNYWLRLNDKPESQMMTNFDYRINQFTDFYDTESDSFDSSQQRLAQHITGYQKRDYLANIINDDISQYKFYQGMIQDKGTRNSIDNLFNSLKGNDETIQFYEEWAVQNGRYGSDTSSQIEIVLKQDEMRESPQSIEILDYIPNDLFDTVYRVRTHELLDRPIDKTFNVFPTKILEEFSESRGYVHEDDVEYKTESINDLKTVDNNLLLPGQYIWITNQVPNDWNVYQIIDSQFVVRELLQDSEKDDFDQTTAVLTVRQNSLYSIVQGDYVAITDAQLYNIFGYFEVKEIDYEKITIIIPDSNDFIDFLDEEFSLSVLRSVRVQDFNAFNDIAQNSIFDNQKAWIDDYGNNTWAVLDNQAVYKSVTSSINPQDPALASDLSAIDQNFAKEITVSKDNKELFIASPEADNGKVFYYRRNQDNEDLGLAQTLTNSYDFYEGDSTQYGESISISDDGLYLAVGVPYASNVKTFFKGLYAEDRDYQKWDIVKYKESLWRANANIYAKRGQVTYSTFDSYLQILNRTDDDSTIINLLSTGNPTLSNVTTDHIIVRAPTDQYLGSKPGDKLKLQWNSNSDIYENTYLPWNGEIAELDKAFIESLHTISAKIDNIIKVDNYFKTPQIGDRVRMFTTNLGSSTGEITYIGSNDGNLNLYLTNVKGTVNPTGEIYVESTSTGVLDQIGNFNEVNYGFDESFNGYWKIDTVSYNNGENTFDQGQGLVYKDLFNSDTYTPSIEGRNEYFNITDTLASVGAVAGDRSLASIIEHLSNSEKESDLWLTRVSTDFTQSVESKFVAVGDENNPSYNFYLYNKNNNVHEAGFKFADINKEQQVYDVWDGYLDFEYEAVEGSIFTIEVGDILKDAQRLRDPLGKLANDFITTANTAEVLYVKTFGDLNLQRVRAYIKITAGDWSLEENVEEYKIRRFRPTDPNDPVAGREVGVVKDLENFTNAVVVPSATNVGKFLVFKQDAMFDQTSLGVIKGKEYLFFTETFGVIGAESLANIPSSLNSDWEQVYNITTPEGAAVKASANLSNGVINQGLVIIYYKSAPDNFERVAQIVSEQNFEVPNSHFGKKVKIISSGTGYKLYVASSGSGDSNNPGCIEYFENRSLDGSVFRGNWNRNNSYTIGETVLFAGKYYIAKESLTATTQNDGTILNTNSFGPISWRRVIDTDYKGIWSVSEEYKIDSIVLHEGKQYRAKTNISPSSEINESNNPVTSIAWELLQTTVEYQNFIPNLSSNIIDSDVTFDTSNMVSFIEDFVMSDAGEVLITKVKKENPDSSIRVEILVYRLELDGRYILSQTIPEPTNPREWGYSFDISPTGDKLAISEPHNSEVGNNFGRVHVYSTVNGQFELSQVLDPPRNTVSLNFGYSVSYGTEVLSITSFAGRILTTTIFDGDETLFDLDQTEFQKVNYDPGVVYIYENVRDKLIFSESIAYDNVTDTFREKVILNENHIYVAVPAKENNLYTGALYDYRKNKADKGWKLLRERINPVDLDKIKGVFLYNRRSNSVVSYLDYIDPIQGKIAGPAEKNIKFKVPFDPAMYNIGASANTFYWEEEQVGLVWWNTSTATFTYPYQGDINYQKDNWNELQPNASIDVCEWVGSELLPSVWDSITDTADGLAQGISGTTLYGDDQYSKKFVYDSESQTFTEKYFYWVKNSKILPSIKSRTLTTLDIARLIATPRQQGYRYVSLLSDNRLVLNNCSSLIYNDDIVLAIRFDNNSKVQNQHLAYKLITDGLDTSLPSSNIELKWFDSLIGFDVNNRPVPDILLTEKQKYGVQSSPRQGMFKNRNEALKQFIERVNYVLDRNLITENFDTSALNSLDPMPSIQSSVFDLMVDNETQLSVIGTKVKQAKLKAIITNGKLIRVEILDPGKGYKTPPTLTIIGQGQDALLRSTINNLGQVTAVEVLSAGSNYAENTQVKVRLFSVLVEADTAIQGKWAIYSYDDIELKWNRVKIQGYNVTRYWKYVDWYKEGYSVLTTPDRIVNNSYELADLNDQLGSIVKIENHGTGGWTLLKKVKTEVFEPYANNYQIIARENGTINFKNNLYTSVTSESGFDNKSFDSSLYDIDPRKEMRIILEAIRDNILIKSLKLEYNQLFIASLRYILTEQNPDWFFKTSFVKVKHLAGTLTKDTTFNVDNLDNFKKYIEEVKPYKTNIREFVSNYKNTEQLPLSTTDFDLPPYFDSLTNKITPVAVKVKDGKLVTSSKLLNDYPRKNWTDNIGTSITEIIILDPGTEYILPPKVEIIGNGTGATAQAYVGYGKITNIVITNKGKNYTLPPTVVITNPPNSEGTVAKAIAIIGDSLARTVLTSVKFDRTSVDSLINTNTLDMVETFVGSGNRTKFELKYPINLDRSTVVVTVNENDVLSSQYTISNKKDTSKSYTRYNGEIVFDTAPVVDGNLVITYKKNLSMLNAVDRIKFAYTSGDNNFGNDLAQLMDGIDYGGVEVKSFNFNTNIGWDTQGWFTDVWDEFNSVYEDEVHMLDDSSAIILDKPLEDNVIYNAYRVSYNVAGNIVSNQRLDDPDYGTSAVQNLDAVCASIVGDGSTQVVYLSDLNITSTKKANEDRVNIVIRKTTSDGSIQTDARTYDLDLDGGSLNYTNAKGITAEEIVVDGDSFVTPETSKSVEELVPGQVQDTLDIQVTTIGADSTLVQYRIFKDILNKTSYSRIDTSPTKTTKAITQYSLSIEVDDASNLLEPDRTKNIPGVLFINKERIEYYIKEGNTLKQIRRGTLGTGVSTIIPVGTDVIVSDLRKLVPYVDTTQSQTATNVDTVDLNFLPLTSDEFEVFVNGIRLNSKSIDKFDPTLGLDSPEADVIVPADFEIEYFNNDTQAKINIINPSIMAFENKNIVIVRKKGNIWHRLGESITETETGIGFFLRAGN